MRILMVSNELGYRGTPRYLGVCARIARQTHDVLVYGIECGGETADALATEGTRVVIGKKGLKEALAFRPEIVHIHRCGLSMWRDTVILKALHRACRCRILETNVFGEVDRSATAELITLHAQISRWDLWRWRRRLGQNRQRGVYLPYLVDTDLFKPASKNSFHARYKIASGAFVIARIGKTDWPFVSQVLHQVSRAHPNIVLLTVADYSDKTLSGYGGQVVTVPRLSGAAALSEFYSAADVVLATSPIGESFGYSIAEPMAAGTPVIAHSTPFADNAQIELASPSCGGFPVATADAAAEEIIDLICQPGKLAAARKVCRSSIISRYGVKAWSPRLLTLYQLLLTTPDDTLESVLMKNGFETDIRDEEILSCLRPVGGGCSEEEKQRVWAFHTPRRYWRERNRLKRLWVWAICLPGNLFRTACKTLNWRSGATGRSAA